MFILKDTRKYRYGANRTKYGVYFAPLTLWASYSAALDGVKTRVEILTEIF